MSLLCKLITITICIYICLYFSLFSICSLDTEFDIMALSEYECRFCIYRWAIFLYICWLQVVRTCDNYLSDEMHNRELSIISTIQLIWLYVWWDQLHCNLSIVQQIQTHLGIRSIRHTSLWHWPWHHAVCIMHIFTCDLVVLRNISRLLWYDINTNDIWCQ